MNKDLKINIIYKLSSIVRNIRIKIFLIKAIPYQKLLAEKKLKQKETFARLRKKFKEVYVSISVLNIDKFTTELWKNYGTRLEKDFFPPTFYFLRKNLFTRTMFATAGGKWLTEELNFLKKNIEKKKLKIFLEEDYVGGPLLIPSNYLTSHNTIHHLYHLIKYQNKTKNDLTKMRNVVDWGGGYGNMAKLFRRINDSCTYTIVDLSLVSCIQWLYLASILGEEKVHIITSKRDKIMKGKINLLPINFINLLKDTKIDLFISTWALSESSKYAQDYVIKKNWFNAKHLLLAFCKSNNILPYSSRLGEMAGKKKAIVEEIPFLRGNYYAFL